MLADSAGLGKTISASRVISELMARSRVSKILIDVSAQPSLQDLLDQAQSDGLLPRSKLAAARSAVAAVAGFLGEPATSIDGHQGFVIAQMKRMRRASSKLASKTLSNY